MIDISMLYFEVDNFYTKIINFSIDTWMLT
jgi:hypothetical protein